VTILWKTRKVAIANRSHISSSGPLLYSTTNNHAILDASLNIFNCCATVQKITLDKTAKL